MTKELQRDYFLRVTNGSELGRLIPALLADTQHKLTAENLQEIGGTKRSAWIGQLASKWFDNFSCTHRQGIYNANYTDVVGRQQTVVNVKQADFAGGSPDGQHSVDQKEHEAIRWPTAPSLITPFDFFRKPTYYETMKAMVELGDHISLAGPPSGGKDTTVMQMAAQTENPLVVVGGDAGLRKRDLIGSMEMFNGSTHFQVSEFAAAAVNGWWALITEINAADPDTILLLNGIIETPHIINIHGKQYPVHPNFRLFISYNPGLIGTKPLPQSFKDRFYSVLVPFLSEKELIKRLGAHGLPTETVLVNAGEWNEKIVWKEEWAEKVVQFGLQLWQAHEDGRLRYQITVRRLLDAIKLMDAGATSGNVKKALKLAALAAIDSPVEYKVAQQVLNDVCQEN